MSESDQTRPSGHTTLTEYDRANARVFFFQAIERDGKKVIEDLIDSSAQDWASRWFAGREWAVRQGERTKSIWADSPKAQERLQFQMFPKGLMAGIEHRRFGTFEYRAWNPLSENKSNAKSRLQEEFRAHLKAEMDEYAREIGYTRRRSRNNLERDARWLVLYQFFEQTFGQIAQAENRGKTSHDVGAPKVQKAVEAFAVLINLPLRQGNRRGRPAETE